MCSSVSIEKGGGGPVRLCENYGRRLLVLGVWVVEGKFVQFVELSSQVRGGRLCWMLGLESSNLMC